MAAKKREWRAREKQKDSKTERKVRPSECRTMMRRRLAAEYEEILGAFVQAAKKGSAAHMKLATALLEGDAKGSAGRGGSAARMLRELDRAIEG